MDSQEVMSSMPQGGCRGAFPCCVQGQVGNWGGTMQVFTPARQVRSGSLSATSSPLAGDQDYFFSPLISRFLFREFHLDS